MDTRYTPSRCLHVCLLASTLVLAHGFDRDMIAGLVDEGLATAHREASTGRATIEVVRIRITEAGRMALEG